VRPLGNCIRSAPFNALRKSVRAFASYSTLVWQHCVRVCERVCDRNARRFGSGISSQGCLLDAAEATGVVSKKGSWYFYGEQRLAQGRDKTLAELAASAPLAECALAHPICVLLWTGYCTDMLEVMSV